MHATDHSQTIQILRHLQAGGSLTPMEALQRFQCLRLSARINELQRLGHEIKCEMVKTPSGKRVGQYSMEKVCRTVPSSSSHGDPISTSDSSSPSMTSTAFSNDISPLTV